MPEAKNLLGISTTDELESLTYGACAAAIIKRKDRQNIYLRVDYFSQDFQTIFNNISSEVNRLTVQNINSVISALKSIDPSIGNSNLSTKEKEVIYRINSIARYSSAYWVYEKDDPQSPWIQFSKDRGGDFPNAVPPDWVYADIKAAYIGALFTMNPWGALGAAAVSSAVDGLSLTA